MSKEVQSECNGCPDCHQCGRRQTLYTWYVCDGCGEEAEYRYDSRDLCKDCLLAELAKDGIIVSLEGISEDEVEDEDEDT